MDPHKPDLVVKKMYISSIRVAQNLSILRKLGITHVLTVCPMRPTHFPGIEYKVVSISDSPDQRIDLKFPECFEFIRYALESGGKILIHCFQGVSRSASIIIAYLMTYHDMSFIQAVNFLKQKRIIINPNFGFMEQLRNYAKKIGKSD